MSKVDWSLAPEGATHYRPDAKNVFWYKERGGDFMYFEDSSGQWCYSSASDRVVRSFIERQSVKPWSGPEDGLPPVGTACEFYERGEWREVEVMYVSQYTVLLKLKCDEHDDPEAAYTPEDMDFRSVRTPEQIAADQRETAIRELMDIAQVDCRVTAARLVDAGFKR